VHAQFFLAFLLTFACQAFGQAAATAPPNLPTDPRELLAMAAPHYDFNDPALRPWHMKATYQLYDEKGKPTEQGTYEYWWASPKVHRSTWTRADATRTDWATADGAIHRKENGGSLRYFERNLNTILLHPLPPRADLESEKMKLDLKVIGEGQSRLTCATAALQWEQNGTLKAQPSAMAQYYCFDPATMALRLRYSNLLTTEYHQIAQIQGRYYARQVAVSIGKQEIFSVSVEVIDGADPSAPGLSPPADSVVVNELAHEPPATQPGGDVTKGLLVRKTQPIYPTGAKAAHVQGTVVLAATIGDDGLIHDLEVLASPSPILRAAALDAVKRWQYKPYLLNGKPVEVETVVNVEFRLSN